MTRSLDCRSTLPEDAAAAVLVGRAWLPPAAGMPGGPTVVTVRGERLVDIGAAAATVSELLARPDPAATVAGATGKDLGPLQRWLDDSCAADADPTRPHLLAPCDLQVVKAAGVTFAASMLERVIEEQARGDAAAARAFRSQIQQAIGSDLAGLKPGSPAATQLKALLIARGLWSQYLEVGIGPDAEIFTKAAPLSSLGTGTRIGLHPGSTWNNPEPEVVLAISPQGRIVGAALGNDVNLRDFEGRSALLLGKAKDNNGSCAIGPFIRLCDARFGLDDLRHAVIALEVAGTDGFVLHGSSSMERISRDVTDLCAQAIGPCHQYPDGLMLFCGTMFAPIDDRDAPGAGFTHHVGDRVTISSPRLGSLVNWVDLSDRIARWEFGIGALMRNLAGRGLLG